ncbi:Plasmodium variant antigen protein Cir/Yir/Bir, putative [Plasmodium chabaudi adami]|uniref:Plasmodium variant antigen protein Cir/Yir/Bir, putative n=1 Tax=Plasmodium chabaudi adami TaxID=5826 RepID=A0A1D3L9I4_PLACE|nr:Plasmodium variant antigen protein Cir/Yir/Bir, putative [Plasmodium chabaudi adami]
MNRQWMCEAFLVADKVINGEDDANITMEEISKKPEFYQYCPNRRCVTDIQRIGALSTHLFEKINAVYNNEYGEYFLMWLSDKLFKMHKEGKKKGQSNRITLDEAYKKYLENHMGNFRYWNVIGNIKGLKEANLKHMSEFYKLFNHICKTIVHYKLADNKNKNLIINSTNSFNQYMPLYHNVSKCNSYLHLLDDLKKMYDKFRNDVKAHDPELANYLQTLTTMENTESYFAKGPKKFEFNVLGCNLKYNDNILVKLEKAKAKQNQKDKEKKGEDIPQKLMLQSPVDQTSSKKLGTGTSPSMSINETDTSASTPIDETDTPSSMPINEAGAPKDNNAVEGSNKSEPNPKGDGQNNLRESNNTLEHLNDAINKLEMPIQFFMEQTTNNIKNLYDTTSSSLENTYNKFTLFAKEMITSAKDMIPQLDGDKFEQNIPHENFPSSTDDPQQTQPQKDKQIPIPQGSSPTEPNNLRQSQQDHAPPRTSLHDSSLQKPFIKAPKAEYSRSKQVNNDLAQKNEDIALFSLITTKLYGITLIGIIGILVPVGLAFMYKYLYYGCGKKSKRKKNMKKVIDMLYGNKTEKTVINSINGKDQCEQL